jgi:hypothetical protein
MKTFQNDDEKLTDVGAEITSDDRLLQTSAPATGNARVPTVAQDVGYYLTSSHLVLPHLPVRARPVSDFIFIFWLAWRKMWLAFRLSMIYVETH